MSDRYIQYGELPFHIDMFVEDSFISHKGGKLVPCRWFGLISKYGEMWGANVLLENGAIYRDIPIHALAFRKDNIAQWEPADAQKWDCYGAEFSTWEYKILRHVDARVKINGKEWDGKYLFTAGPLGDGFSRDPGQAKEFTFVQLDNGRLTCVSTDMVLFQDKSWNAGKLAWPVGLKRKTKTWHCE